jgi:mycothiol synthase
MDRQTGKSLTVERANPAELSAALQIVFGRMEEPVQAAQIALAEQEIEHGGDSRQILLVARRAGELAAAAWIQIMPGRVASLWPIGLAAGEGAATTVAILEGAIVFAASAQVRLIQTLLETDVGPEAAGLRQCGFQQITDLLYLVSLPDDFPAVEPMGDLVFEPIAEAGVTEISDYATQRLTQVIQRTYVGTLDCPGVHQLRKIEDVLATYRGIGRFDPARWYFVRYENADIGCLLLANHTEDRTCELLYVGITPEVRGSGYGLQIVRWAQWIAGICGLRKARGEKSAEENVAVPIERFVLAVDAENSPAISMYAAAGFKTWDRRSVFLREIVEKK